MSREFIAQQGFLTIAQNSGNTDYLTLAYVQAMSIKLTMPGSKCAVLVDAETMNSVTPKHHKVFDNIIYMEQDYAKDEGWKLSNEWQVFQYTPFKETIKLESDILFTRDIRHWVRAFRFQDVVLSTGCKDYQGNISTSREYRKLFDDNDLPDTYSGLMYFRYSRFAAEFFDLAKQIFLNWEYIKNNILNNCRDDFPTTDVVYAITAKILGVEKCTLPSMNWINFVHMKPAINDWSNKPWHEMVLSEVELPMIRIANTNQYHPFHYHEKQWIIEEIINEYEQQFNG